MESSHHAVSCVYLSIQYHYTKSNIATSHLLEFIKTVLIYSQINFQFDASIDGYFFNFIAVTIIIITEINY